MQVQPVGRAGRADARLHAELVEGDQHDRPVILLGQPAGDEADHAGVPAAAGQHQRRIALGIELLLDLLGGRQLNAPLQAFAAAVELVDVLGELLGPLAASRW